MRSLLAMSLGLVLCHSALAETYTLVSQSRTLDTSYDGCAGFSDSDSAQAPDAGPFNMAITSANNMSAYQDSHFESRLIVGSANTSGLGGCGCGGFPDCAGGSANSAFDATFAVAHPTRFHLFSNFVGVSCGGSEMSFSGPGGVIVAHTHTGTDDLTGELAPGEYQFLIDARSCWGTCMGCQGPNPSHFNFTLELRRFGDANGDSNVNIDDLLAVIGAWGPCPPKAACDSDLNASGSVDVDDLLEVISHWGS